MTDKVAGPDGSELSEGLGPLPATDLQADPCSADGTQTDYYTAGTVRRLLAAERERIKGRILEAWLQREASHGNRAGPYHEGMLAGLDAAMALASGPSGPGELPASGGSARPGGLGLVPERDQLGERRHEMLPVWV